VSLDACLPDLERKGAIDVGRSKEARELYAELKTLYSRTHDDATAAALASQKTIERLEAAAAHKKRNLIRQAQAQAAAIDKIRRYNGGDPTAPGRSIPRAPKRCSASTAAPGTTIRLTRGSGLSAATLTDDRRAPLQSSPKPCSATSATRRARGRRSRDLPSRRLGTPTRASSPKRGARRPKCSARATTTPAARSASSRIGDCRNRTRARSFALPASTSGAISSCRCSIAAA
jgi:hypothetical protein